MWEKYKWKIMLPLVLVLLFIYTRAFDYAVKNGMEFGVDLLGFFVVGILFFVIGCFLPRCRQNTTIGIKVPWVYTSEENWNQTHRFGGKVWMIGGILLSLSVFAPNQIKGRLTVFSILFIVLIPSVYSYLFYRKEKARGLCMKAGLFVGRGGKAGGLFTVAILMIVGVLLVTGNITMSCEEERLFIEADYWEDLSLSYDTITKAEYREEGVGGSRVGGFGSFRLLMGNFENEEFGYYTRYTYAGCDSAIVLYRERGEVVLSLENEEKTKEFYDTLLKQINQ